MKFIIPTIGSRGDIQPYLALAKGLQAAGHTVSIATHPFFRSLVTDHGINFIPIGPDINMDEEAARLRGKSNNWVLGFMRVMRFSFDILEKSHQDLLAACQQHECVIVSHSAAGKLEADQLGLPTISVTLMPSAIPVEDPQSSWLARFGGKLAGSLMGLMMSRPLNKIRKKFGVASMGPEGITSKLLNLIPISPAIYPPNPLWEPRHQLTGYWFLDEPENWQPPAELQTFLSQPGPVIVVSLGAMSTGEKDIDAIASLFIEATQAAKVRAVIQGWPEAAHLFSRQDHIFHAGSIPHSWLLRQVQGVVHHGGFGTTAAGLRAGIPALVIPHIIDQFIWGSEIEKREAGPAPIPRAKLTRETLVPALEQLVNDANIQTKARSIGDRIAEENGVQTAVRLIEQKLDQLPSGETSER